MARVPKSGRMFHFLDGASEDPPPKRVPPTRRTRCSATGVTGWRRSGGGAAGAAVAHRAGAEEGRKGGSALTSEDVRQDRRNADETDNRCHETYATMQVDTPRLHRCPRASGYEGGSHLVPAPPRGALVRDERGWDGSPPDVPHEPLTRIVRSTVATQASLRGAR